MGRRKKKKMSKRKESQKTNNQGISNNDQITKTTAIDTESTATEDYVTNKESQIEETNNTDTSKEHTMNYPLEKLEDAIHSSTNDEAPDHKSSINNQAGLAPETAEMVGLTFVKGLIPNEQNGNISATSIPLIKKYQPCGISVNKETVGTRVRDAMAIIAYNQKVVNPHEFALYLLNFESKTPNKQKDNSPLSNDTKQLSMDTNFQDTFFERRLYDTDVLENILWPTKSTEPALSTAISAYCLDSLQHKDNRSLFLTQNGISNSPSNFLVYKRKDAKIAWPSAVSLLHKKQEGQDMLSTRDLTTT